MRTPCLALAFSFLLMGTLSAQRLTLIEQFTNASCSNCASFNPPIFEFADTTSFTFAIAWQINIPYDYDSMYHDNPDLMDFRRSYYNISSAPSTAFEGSEYNGSSSNFSNVMEGLVTNRSALPALIHRDTLSPKFPFMTLLPIQHDYELFYKAIVDSNLNGTYRLHALVIEHEVNKNDYAGPAGTNSEQVHHNVVRYNFFGKEGQRLANLSAGDTIFIDTAVVEDSIPVLNQDSGNVGIVIFLQDSATQEILFVDEGDFEQPENTTSLTPSKAVQPVTVYPNPAHEHLNIELPDESIQVQNIRIYNLQGQQVYTQQSAPGALLHLPVANLAEGLYFLRIADRAGSKIYTQKFLVKH